ncbi:MAG TPA: signal peptidase II, partial [Vicinamibacteria bacterium]
MREDLGRRLYHMMAGVTAILAFDQATKLLAARRLSPGQSIEVIPEFLHLTLVRNTGMAFGLLSELDIPYKTVLMTLLSLVALGAVIYYGLRTPHGHSLSHAGVIFILGGALGNIADRARLGYVIDFIDVFYRDAHWPAFNVADS